MKSLQENLALLRRQVQAVMETSAVIIRQADEEASAGTRINRVAIIQRVVAEHYKQPVSVFASIRRPAAVVECRHVAMYLCRELTKYTQEEIAARFRPGMDHATIGHAIQKVAARADEDPAFLGMLSILRHRCEGAIDAADMPLFAAAG